MADPSRLALLAAFEQDRVPGLIWAFAMPAGGSPAPLAPEDVRPALEAGDGWVWLHVDLVDQRAHGWIEQACGLPAAAVAMLEGRDESFALAHEAGVVHGVLPDLHGEAARQPTSIGRLHFAVGDRLLVTARRHRLVSAEEVHDALRAGRLHPASPFGLFGAIVLAFCRNAGRRLAEATLQLDEAEDHLVAGNAGDDRRQLRDVRRLAVQLHRPIAALVALIADEEREDWTLPRESHDALARLEARLQRLDREVVMVSDRAKLIQDEMAAELADESNRSLRALAVMSALLLPGTLVAGIFGMNTDDLPLIHTTGGFAITILIGVAATVLFYWIMARAGARLRL